MNKGEENTKLGARWHYLDALKALAMACVCLYHFCWRLDMAFADPAPAGMLVQRWLWGMNSVCVPLFMMVNGALLLNKKLDAKKHFVRWGFMIAGMYVWFLATLFVVHAWRHGVGYAITNLPGMLQSALYLYGYEGVTVDHLWFVRMLIALYILVPLMHAAFCSPDAQMKKALRISLAALAALSFVPHDFELVNAYLPGLRSIGLGALDTLNPARNGVYGAMMVYFMLGGYLHRHAQRLANVKWRSCALLFAAGSLVLFAQWYLMTRRNEAVYDIVYNGYNCLATLAMSTALFIGALKLEGVFARVKPLSALAGLIGRNTLSIYYLHWILGLTLGWGSVHLLSGLAQMAVMLLVCALAGEMLRRIPLLRRLV